MLVIARRYGQLGNRLFLFAHLIAAAKHYGVALRNPCFAEYAHLFPRMSDDLWCRYEPDSNVKSSREKTASRHALPPSLAQRTRLMHAIEIGTKTLYLARLREHPFKIIRLSKHDECDLAGNEFESAARSGRVVLLQGWRFRSDAFLMQHWASIKDFFSLGVRDRNAVDESLATARRDCDVVVGVHIRRGDYANFMDGRYYFDDACYARWMHQVREQFPGRKVNFLVCTHEAIDESSFKGLSVFRGPGSAIGDMYSLAETDVMLGPPSTFTGWASFIGQAPRIELESAEKSVALPPHVQESILSGSIQGKGTVQIVGNRLVG
ncbi:alpha-1,2-fucosyltransferase [Roseiconus lacunae]|uniref:alpha-1,2-fucosyltransferase n=1 Tax=Roseiconus lacunae TaxID=2605694 RepID=UPI001E31A49C|nr:alpha-1,2-fucosyltransferase [Roseiconus lacunae]MCD0463740.1 alpha-1,2-fucosyltransferase [Roseiconus lacunae]